MCFSQQHSETKFIKVAPTSQDTNSSIHQSVKTAIDFLKWYRDNRKRLIKIQLVNNEDNAGKDKYDTTKFYSVNFDSAEKYLKEFRQSGYVSDTYIDKWKQYFKKCDANFKKNPQNDGIPDGFDYDFVMLTQEFQEQLSNINKIKLTVNTDNIDKDKAIVEMQLYSFGRLTFSLTKYDGRWKIDDIKK
jgi:hypothetical protein